MSRVLTVLHSNFGRVCLQELSRGIAMHAHREAQLVFHVSGSTARMVMSGEEVLANTEQAIAINPLQPHELLPATTWQPEAERPETERPEIKPETKPPEIKRQMLNLVLFINPACFQRVTGKVTAGLEFGSNAVALDASIVQMVEDVFDLLIRGDHLDQIDQRMIDLASACYTQSWVHAPQTFGTDSTARTVKSIDRRVNLAIEMMHERIHAQVEKDCVIVDIARESGLSRPHFFKLFHSNTGVTPKVYMNTLRVEKAIEKLTKTDQPVTDIGIALGFASQPSFSRFFCANVGISPSDYRRAASLVG